MWMIVAVAAVAVAALAFVMLRGQPAGEGTGRVAVEPASEPMDWPTQQAAYLVDNLAKPGWQATASGLQYTVLAAGDGTKPRPAPGSEVTVHYEGRLTTGQVFDSSYRRGEPATFPLNGVIPGWQEGVPMMRVGETWEFAIPAELAYGARGAGPIPGGSTLIFKIELLDAKTPAP